MLIIYQESLHDAGSTQYKMNQKMLKTRDGVCKPVITWMRKRTYTCISEECMSTM